jgi:hypothetical protein
VLVKTVTDVVLLRRQGIEAVTCDEVGIRREVFCCIEGVRRAVLVETVADLVLLRRQGFEAVTSDKVGI